MLESAPVRQLQSVVLLKHLSHTICVYRRIVSSLYNIEHASLSRTFPLSGGADGLRRKISYASDRGGPGDALPYIILTSASHQALLDQ